MSVESLLFRDELTGVYNRRYLRKLKDTFFTDPKVISENVVIAVCDIDHFKDINDTYGHLVGDRAIVFFANFLRTNLRKDDVIIRYGGDEFVIIQRGIKIQDAVLVWERLIRKIKASSFDNNIQLSISVGLASYPHDARTFDSLFEIADSRLYMAKRNGRGRVGLTGQHGITIPPPDFIDRREETVLLKENVNKGIITLVRGEAGIGKTRFLREVLGSLSNVHIIWSDCLAFERKIPYYPLRELVKYKIKRTGRVLVENIPLSLKIELGKIIPELLEEFDNKELSRFDTSLDRYRLYESFKYILTHGDTRNLLVIDNMQWIDDESLEVLRYILKDFERDKLNFVFAMRSEETSENVEKFVGELHRAGLISEIRLSPLSDIHMRAVVRSITGGPVPQLEQYISETGAGNVFYTEEIIKSLYQEGYLYHDGSNWQFKVPEKFLLPRGVDDVVKRKFHTLSESARELLKILSVARKGYIELLVHLSGYNEGMVFDLLEEAIKSGLVKESEEDDSVQFKSEILRASIYSEEISRLRRRKLHAKVAEYLEHNYPEDNEEEIAYHYYEAGNTVKLIEYAEIAGDKARALYANEKAIRFYKWGLEAIEKSHDKNSSSVYLRLLDRLVSVMVHTGKFKEAEGYAQKLLERSLIDNAKDFEVKALEHLSSIAYGLSLTDKAIEYAEKALEKATAYKLDKETLLAHNSLATLLQGIGEYDKALRHYNEALKMAEAQKLLELKCRILINIAGLYYYMGKIEKSLQLFEESHDLVEKYGMKKELMNLHLNAGVVYDAIGKFEMAIAHTEKSLKVAREIGDISAIGLILNNLGAMYLAKGEFEVAERFIRESLKIHTTISNLEKQGFNYENLAFLYMSQGNIKEALTYYEKAAEIAEQTRDVRGVILSRMTVGSIYSLMGNLRMAEDTLTDVLEKCREIQAPLLEVDTLKTIALVYIAHNQPDKAEASLKEMEHIILKNKLDEKRIDFDMVKARLSKARGHVDDALSILKGIEKDIRNAESPETKISYYILLARCYFEKGEIEKSLSSLIQVEKFIEEYPDAIYRAEYKHVSGLIYRKIDPERSIADLKEALRLYKKMGFMQRVNEVEKDLNLPPH